MLRGNFIALNACTRKEKKSQVSNLRSHCKKLGKREKRKQSKQKNGYNEEHKSVKFETEN